MYFGAPLARKGVSSLEALFVISRQPHARSVSNPLLHLATKRRAPSVKAVPPCRVSNTRSNAYLLITQPTNRLNLNTGRTRQRDLRGQEGGGLRRARRLHAHVRRRPPALLHR